MIPNHDADIERIMELLGQRGHSQYGSESVTQLEHALQAATLAESESAEPSLIAAALLHDLGHLLHDLPDDAPENGVDDRHEVSAFHFLKSVFSPAVTDPIRFHVRAKRYLCTTDPDYQRALSEPSQISLALQGGTMTDAEVTDFEAEPFFEASIRLRRWDDRAKVVEAQTPPLEHFRPYLRQALTAGQESR